MKIFNYKIPKPVIYLSAAGTLVGVACIIKEAMGGPRYRKDILANDKVVIVTGANTGIGKHTAWELAKRGAHVYMACRDLEKCEETREDIVLNTENKYVYCRKCDLSSLESVRDFVAQFKKEQTKLDILINNAGVMRCPKSKTKEGFELQLGVNHLGHFLLTNLLLNELKAAAPSRIVNISSIAHRRGKIKKFDLNSDKDYDPSDAYSQSKLANVLFSLELSKRLEGTGITVNSVHPGLVDTEIIRHMSFFNSWFSTIFIKPFIWPFIKGPAQGAQTSIYAALEPKLEKVSGKYFSNSAEEDVADAGKDERVAIWLWKVSEKWTRLNE